MNRHIDDEHAPEVSKLRDENRRLKDLLQRAEKANQKLKDMVLRTETRCDTYQRDLLARLDAEEHNY